MSISEAELNRDEKILAAHLSDMVEGCCKSFRPCFTFFLTERECVVAENVLNRLCGSEDTPCFLAYGGYEGAQRRVMGFFPPYGEADFSLFPITAVKFTYRREDKLSHRDFLGCLMNLQIERRLIGDIICDEGKAFALMNDNAAELAISSVTKVGRVGVKTAIADKSDLIVRHDFFKETRASVASMRLDCILASAVNISREKAAILIRSGGVSVNHIQRESVSHTVNDGDLLSVKGFGRFLISADGGETRKGRLHITVKKYL